MVRELRLGDQCADRSAFPSPSQPPSELPTDPSLVYSKGARLPGKAGVGGEGASRPRGRAPGGEAPCLQTTVEIPLPRTRRTVSVSSKGPFRSDVMCFLLAAVLEKPVRQARGLNKRWLRLETQSQERPPAREAHTCLRGQETGS